MILVGDNPFHGISHLSQDRVKARGSGITQAKFASNIVVKSLASGADGFMFSVDETTLDIVKSIRKELKERNARLLPIVPYAYGYVRQMVQGGGMTGLLKDFLKKTTSSMNVSAALAASKAVSTSDPVSLMKAYLLYEISRVESASGSKKNLHTLFLHEIVIDMALALNLEKITKAFCSLMKDRGIVPGFETRNFPFLVKKLQEWNIRLEDVAIVAPFNSIGFQMTPSREECESVLARMPISNTIAMSILAAGYLKLEQALDYISSLPNLSGLVLGVSNENQAEKSFSMARDRLGFQTMTTPTAARKKKA